MDTPVEVTRKQFLSKSLLAGLGVGSLALLFGSSGGIGSEVDPLAVLRSPLTVQKIKSTDNLVNTELTFESPASTNFAYILSVNEGFLQLNAKMLSTSNNQELLSYTDDLGNTSGLVVINPSQSFVTIGGYLGGGIDGLTSLQHVMFGDDPRLFPTARSGIAFESGSGFGNNSGLVGTGAQVGLPTSSLGVDTGSSLTRGDHRHAFSGRFVFSGLEFNALLPGGAFPDKFARIKIQNNWTLRRIWAFTKNGPTGGTETYGLVSAAGALQGVAVTIPASAGAVSENESALQVTNLGGGGLFYLAQTASTAVVASTNVEIGIEYTMNV